MGSGTGAVTTGCNKSNLKCFTTADFSSFDDVIEHSKVGLALQLARDNCQPHWVRVNEHLKC